jgi:hypothetical protein
MKRPLFTIFNVIYQVIICWVLVILNAYYNDLIIPESLAHSAGKVGMKILIALAEGAILIGVFYAINRAILSDADDKQSQKNVAKRTGIVHLIITACL